MNVMCKRNPVSQVPGDELFRSVLPGLAIQRVTSATSGTMRSLFRTANLPAPCSYAWCYSVVATRWRELGGLLACVR